MIWSGDEIWPGATGAEREMIVLTRRVCWILSLTIALVLALPGRSIFAQGLGGGGGTPLRSPKQAAPADLTGYWVSVVVEDWRYRMIDPNKGDFGALPLNAEARKVAVAWDPAKDPAPAEDCRNYGAVNLMRQPGRLHITWQDDQTLKVESDAGAQTRVISFGPSQSQGGDWQGVSQASWDAVAVGRGGGQVNGSLKIVTTKLKPGFLRKNGAPYSANTTLTEYFDRIDEPSGNSYLVVTTTVEDPTYLSAPYLTSVHFRRQPDATGWKPTTCR